MTRREQCEQRWLQLTRHILPGVAVERQWPISLDHCFMRVFLDNAYGGRWADHIDKRPAFRHAPDAVLARAVRLAEAVLDARENLDALNLRSMQWCGNMH